MQRDEPFGWVTTPRVYAAINAVQRAMARTGIAKDRRNTQGSGYNFRGIDDVLNALSPVLAEHGLCIIPRMIGRTCEERQSKSGGALFYVTVEAEFDFVAAADGSRHTARTFGEAMDSGDKATNKAMSAAYKYAAFQAFAIPTEGDNDADAETHAVAPDPAAAAKANDFAAAVRQPTREETSRAKDFADAIKDAQDDAALAGVAKELAASGLPPDLLAKLRATYNARRAEIAKAAA